MKIEDNDICFLLIILYWADKWLYFTQDRILTTLNDFSFENVGEVKTKYQRILLKVLFHVNYQSLLRKIDKIFCYFHVNIWQNRRRVKLRPQYLV